MDLARLQAEPSLLEERWDGGAMGLDDESFDAECDNRQQPEAHATFARTLADGRLRWPDFKAGLRM